MDGAAIQYQRIYCQHIVFQRFAIFYCYLLTIYCKYEQLLYILLGAAIQYQHIQYQHIQSQHLKSNYSQTIGRIPINTMPFSRYYFSSIKVCTKVVCIYNRLQVNSSKSCQNIGTKQLVQSSISLCMNICLVLISVHTIKVS